MKLSDAGLKLICEFEGYHTRLPDGGCAAYLCPAGVVTIGFGCTEGGIKIGDVWTREQAEAALRRELAKHEAAVTKLVSVDLTQGQFDALVSFSYNCGTGALAGSGLLKKLNKGDYAGACKEFAKWDKATVGGKKKALRGLTIRRAREAALFATRDEAPMMAQKVEIPKEPITATQATIAAVPVAASAPSVVQAVSDAVRVPSPPTAILETATAWRGFSGQVIEFGAFAVSSPKSIIVIGVAIAAMVFGPKIAPRMFGRE